MIIFFASLTILLINLNAIPLFQYLPKTHNCQIKAILFSIEGNPLINPIILSSTALHVLVK